MHLVRYREAIDHLMAMPPSLPADFTPDVTRRAGLSTALLQGRTWLDPVEVSALGGLCDTGRCSYSWPVMPTKRLRQPARSSPVAVRSQ